MEKAIWRSWCGIVILAVSISCAVGQTHAASADDPPVAPGKFIPTFTIIYGSPKSAQVLKEATRFDLIDAGAYIAARDGSSWPALKKLNPHLKIVVYRMGPGEVNRITGVNPGEDWSWITANHGIGSADRWTAIGTHGDYLQSNDERLMLIGNPAWQQSWIEGVNRFWSPTSPNRDADGIFADNTNYEWPSYDHWYRQGTQEPDVPADYFHNGVYDAESWKAQAQGFLDRAVTALADQQRLLIPNFGFMSKDPDSWHDLDSQPHPVFAAMEEGAFATPWGAKGQFTFYSEKDWLHQVNGMRQLQHIRALMLVHGLPNSEAKGLSLMDVADASGTRGWDALWFGLTSFLQGYDDVRQNAYLGFTVWGYTAGVFWLDEFDPAHLNLGRALGESHWVDGAAGHCYVREFDSGWAAVNPTDTAAQGVSVPEGQARVLDHETFEHPEAQSLVTQFNLPAHRGVVLLKAGRRVGNTDPASVVSPKAP